MITYDQFLEQMKRLHSGFGQGPKGDSDSGRLADKVGEWFAVWQTTSRNVSYDCLVAMVGRAISELDRMPSFSVFRHLKSEVVDLSHTQTASCDRCASTGLLWASKEVPLYGRATFVFRCGICDNWRGKYDGLSYYSADYTLESGTSSRTFHTDQSQEKPEIVQIAEDIFMDVGDPASESKERDRRYNIQKNMEEF